MGYPHKDSRVSKHVVFHGRSCTCKLNTCDLEKTGLKWHVVLQGGLPWRLMWRLMYKQADHLGPGEVVINIKWSYKSRWSSIWEAYVHACGTVGTWKSGHEWQVGGLSSQGGLPWRRMYMHQACNPSSEEVKKEDM